MIDIFAFLLYTIFIIVVIIFAQYVTVNVFKCSDKVKDSVNFLLLLFINLTVLITINSHSMFEYEVVKNVDSSDIEYKANKVCVDDILIPLEYVFYISSSNVDNYLIKAERNVSLFVGIKVKDTKTYLVVNKEVKDKNLKNIKEVRNISFNVELNKFMVDVRSNKEPDKNYDKSIKGILGEKEENEESVESMETLENVKDTNSDKVNAIIKDQLEQISELETSIEELKSRTEELEAEVKTLKSMEKRNNQIVISNVNIAMIVGSVIALVLLGLFVYGRVIRIRTNSKKELLITASEAKIREGVMLDKET